MLLQSAQMGWVTVLNLINRIKNNRNVRFDEKGRVLQIHNSKVSVDLTRPPCPVLLQSAQIGWVTVLIVHIAQLIFITCLQHKNAGCKSLFPPYVQDTDAVRVGVLKTTFGLASLSLSAPW